jgi:hypothetical protein
MSEFIMLGHTSPPTINCPQCNCQKKFVVDLEPNVKVLEEERTAE